MSGESGGGPTLPHPKRRKTPKVHLDAEETTCEECGATIEIDVEEKIVDAVVRHYKTEHGLDK